MTGSEHVWVVRTIQHTARQLMVVIIATVLCGVIATLGSVVYTRWANDRQDKRWCKLLTVVIGPDTPPATARQQQILDALKELYDDYKCASELHVG